MSGFWLSAGMHSLSGARPRYLRRGLVLQVPPQRCHRIAAESRRACDWIAREMRHLDRGGTCQVPCQKSNRRNACEDDFFMCLSKLNFSPFVVFFTQNRVFLELLEEAGVLFTLPCIRHHVEDEKFVYANVFNNGYANEDWVRANILNFCWCCCSILAEKQLCNFKFLTKDSRCRNETWNFSKLPFLSQLGTYQPQKRKPYF